MSTSLCIETPSLRTCMCIVGSLASAAREVFIHSPKRRKTALSSLILSLSADWSSLSLGVDGVPFRRSFARGEPLCGDWPRLEVRSIVVTGRTGEAHLWLPVILRSIAGCCVRDPKHIVGVWDESLLMLWNDGLRSPLGVIQSLAADAAHWFDSPGGLSA